jgi:hypothetical protein
VWGLLCLIESVTACLVTAISNILAGVEDRLVSGC